MKKILIIEDDKLFQRILEETISNYDLGQTETIESGEEGGKIAIKGDFDCILLDIILPDIHGFDLCKYLHNNTLTAHVPIIILTALKNEEDIVKGFETGAFDYITKDSTLPIIAARIKSAIRHKEFYDELLQANLELQEEKEQTNKLLYNILPGKVADEMKAEGYSKPRRYNLTTVLFTDFVGFTYLVETSSAIKVLDELDARFDKFDSICDSTNVEKIKTIGDSYMAVGGLPNENLTNPFDVCLAALQMRSFIFGMKEINEKMGLPYWEMRIGINTGSVIAGVIGKHRFIYDVWGDAVNLASRMEANGIPNEINISKFTYDHIKDFFECEARGKLSAKHKGDVEMFILKRLLPEYSADKNGILPNDLFYEKLDNIRKGKSTGDNFEEVDIEITDAIKFLKNKSYEKALTLFEKLYKLHPSNPDIINYLGIACYKLKNLKEAYKILSKGIKDNPDDKKLRQSLEIVKSQMKNREQEEEKKSNFEVF